jgi:uncharacterized protein
MPLKISETSKGRLIISVRVVPGARKSELAGLYQDNFKIKIKSPPVEGKANDELISFLSELLGISKKSIIIIRGQNSRLKVIELAGITKELLLQKLS